jgi:hypothetical protein
MTSASRALKALAFVSTATIALAAEAQPPDEPAARIASLVRQLGSFTPEDRTKAESELRGLGTVTRPALEAAVTDRDPEIRARAANLLQQIKVAELWSPSLFKLRADRVLASQVFQALGDQTGNRVLVGDPYGAFLDTVVDVHYESGAFWQVLDDVCRMSDNHPRVQYDARRPGLLVIAGAAGFQPVAYSGPVRAAISTARRSFSEELKYENRNSETTHTFEFNLQMNWEDRFRLVAYRSQLDVVEAVTNDGAQLPARQGIATGWSVASAGTRQVSMTVRVEPPRGATHLDLMKLRWGLIAVGDMASLEFSDLSAGSVHCQDDVQLTVLGMEERAAGRFEISLAVSRDLAVPEPADLIFQENQVELFDAEGRALSLQGQQNSTGERGAQLKLGFVCESGTGRPHVMRFQYPRIRSQKELDIVFRDVPLPHASP